MGNETYTITELENKTGISRRTIHYYNKQKLIPPPEGKGGSAKYGTEHYYRLMLIKHMQKSHLKLSGIREALDAMSTGEMKELTKVIDNISMDWDSDSLGNWMMMNVPTSESESMPDVDEMREPANMSFLDVPRKSKKKQKPANKSFFRNLKRKHSIDESSWGRYSIVDGIEVHIRNDLMNEHESILKSWIDYLKNLAIKYL